MVWSGFPLPTSATKFRNMSRPRCMSLLNSCCSVKQLFQIHGHAITSGLQRNYYVTDKLIRICTSCSLTTTHPIDLINHAHYVVYCSDNLECFSWNRVVRAYAYATSNCGSQREALSVFLHMRRLGIKPDEHTFNFIFKVCTSFSGLNDGLQIHADVLKHGFCFSAYVQSTLINMYGSCKEMLDAYKVFDEMPQRTFVAWKSLMSASVDCSLFYNAFQLFIKMREDGYEPEETTMLILLTACAKLGNLSLGKCVHSQVIENGMIVAGELGTALVDMYGKCGDVNYASLVFNRIEYRHMWTWSAMIIGFAQHGFARNALELFKEMRSYSIMPSESALLGVLCACSHAGLVEDGQSIFNEMEQVHGMKPTAIHYGVMVDMLGRAGHLKEAYDFATKMPFKVDPIVWTALLSACNIHDVNDCLGVGEKVRERLIELEPKRSGNYVMLASKYAKVGNWEKAAHLRRKMKDEGLKKVGGESCVEVDGSIVRFFSGDCSCVRCDDILLLLNVLNLHTKT